MLVSRVEEAFELNNQIKELTKKLDVIKKEIKSGGLGNYDGINCYACVEDRVTTYIDEERALRKVKELGAKWLIKEAVDTDKLEDAIASGELDAKDFAECLKEKHTSVLTFKKR